MVNDGIKDFKVGRLSHFVLVDPNCNHKYLYQREAEGDLTETKVNVSSEVDYSNAATSQVMLEDARNRFSLRSCRVSITWPAARLWPSETDFRNFRN